jgi:hypothetical protein
MSKFPIRKSSALTCAAPLNASNIPMGAQSFSRKESVQLFTPALITCGFKPSTLRCHNSQCHRRIVRLDKIQDHVSREVSCNATTRAMRKHSTTAIFPVPLKVPTLCVVHSTRVQHLQRLCSTAASIAGLDPTVQRWAKPPPRSSWTWCFSRGWRSGT